MLENYDNSLESWFFGRMFLRKRKFDIAAKKLKNHTYNALRLLKLNKFQFVTKEDQTFCEPIKCSHN